MTTNNKKGLVLKIHTHLVARHSKASEFPPVFVFAYFVEIIRNETLLSASVENLLLVMPIFKLLSTRLLNTF